MINPTAGLRMGELTIESVFRGRPPLNCSMGCPEFRSVDICSTCYRRPVKHAEKTTRPVMVRIDGQDQITEIVEVK